MQISDSFLGKPSTEFRQAIIVRIYGTRIHVFFMIEGHTRTIAS